MNNNVPVEPDLYSMAFFDVQNLFRHAKDGKLNSRFLLLVAGGVDSSVHFITEYANPIMSYIHVFEAIYTSPRPSRSPLRGARHL